MRVYISGPMTGLPDMNRNIFQLCEELLRKAGHDPINPHKLDHPDQDYFMCLRRDIKALMSCEMLIFIPGSHESRGANIEIRLASQVGIPVHDAEVFLKEVLNV